MKSLCPLLRDSNAMPLPGGVVWSQYPRDESPEFNLLTVFRQSKSSAFTMSLLHGILPAIAAARGGNISSESRQWLFLDSVRSRA